VKNHLILWFLHYKSLIYKTLEQKNKIEAYSNLGKGISGIVDYIGIERAIIIEKSK